MVLAAGLGKRLRPLTVYHAKPALPVMGRPLIDHVLRRLARQGIREVVVNMHHRPESVESALSSAPSELTLHRAFEPELLGTAGGLKHVAGYFAAEKAFLLVNADTLVDFDLDALASSHFASGAAATLLLRPRPSGSLYSSVELRRDGRIESVGKDDGELMFAGVWVLSPSVFERLSGRPAGLEKELLPALVGERQAVGSVQDVAWITVDTPRRYWTSCITMARQRLFKEDWAVNEQRARDRALVFAGPETRLDRGARFQGAVVLGRNCTVGSGARLERVVCWDGVKIPSGVSVTDSILTDGVAIPRGAELESRLVMRVGEDETGLRRREIQGDLVVSKLKREQARGI